MIDDDLPEDEPYFPDCEKCHMPRCPHCDVCHFCEDSDDTTAHEE